MGFIKRALMVLSIAVLMPVFALADPLSSEEVKEKIAEIRRKNSERRENPNYERCLQSREKDMKIYYGISDEDWPYFAPTVVTPNDQDKILDRCLTNDRSPPPSFTADWKCQKMAEGIAFQRYRKELYEGKNAGREYASIDKFPADQSWIKQCILNFQKALKQ